MNKLLLLSVATLFSVGCGDNIDDPNVLRGPSIGGSVFQDRNGDGVASADEQPVEGVTVYLDFNQSEILDPGEPSTLTDADGRYAFRDLAPGNYEVRQVMQFGTSSTFESGRLPRTRPTSATSAIIGGSDADALEYPFMVSVGFVFDSEAGTELFAICGGVLASDRFVVTAAHCSEGVDPLGAGVELGTSVRGSAQAQLVTVAGIAIHPLYTGDVEGGYDIAVWQLSERLDLEGRGLHTVDLLGSSEQALESEATLATTIGWGVSDNSSDVLQEVHVPLTSAEDCAAAYPRVGATAIETQICAGVVEGGIDSCQGDSGGPLLVRDPSKNAWVHAGVTSWGDGCAVPGFPGVYARTTTLRDWAHTEMLEPSRVFRVDVTTEPILVDFANQRTTRPLTGETEARWQLTSVSVAGAPEGVVEANTALDFRYRLLDELPQGQRAFTCRFDPDGPGPAVATSESCDSGASQLSFAGYADGVFRPTFSTTEGDVTLSRTPLIIAGTPETHVVATNLTAADAVDPDYNDTYFIDYYEVTAAPDNVLTLVSLESSAFGPFVVLYDADVRTAAGGGVLSIGNSRLEFLNEPGRRYLIGVSTTGVEETGGYTLTVTGGGTPTPTSL